MGRSSSQNKNFLWRYEKKIELLHCFVGRSKNGVFGWGFFPFFLFFFAFLIKKILNKTKQKPTAGMDPLGSFLFFFFFHKMNETMNTYNNCSITVKREIWTLITQYKAKNRVVVLTTHRFVLFFIFFFQKKRKKF